MNFKQAAIAVLKAVNSPLHSEEITTQAIEQGLLETEGKTPEATMAAQLYTDIKQKGAKSAFVQVDKNTFALNSVLENELPTPEQVEKELVAEDEVEEEMRVESGYVGTAGEHRVCSELLFRGFNASLMGVDEGIDIAALKNKELIGIQVKTAHADKRGSYPFNVRKKSFMKHKSSNVYYIFLLRSTDALHFLILPFHEMEKKIKEGAIREIRQGTSWRVAVSFHENKVYIGNRQHDMTYYLNNWDVIAG